MSLATKEQSKRLLAVHGWSAVILGLFLYVVVLTGAIAVLSHEIGLWSGGGAGHDSILDRPINSTLVDLAETVDDQYLEEVSVYQNAAGSIFVFFHTHETTDSGVKDKGVRFILDPDTLEVLRREEGFASDFAADRESALDHFIVNLHVRLHAPNPWGLFATGILGFVMLAAVVSGIILHKHLIRDLFLAPRFSSFLLNKRDRHILAGSWSLPFGFILAFTGAFFSFAGSVGLPIVAMAAFGGDQVKMIETVIGVPAAEDPTPAPIANLDEMLAQSSALTGSSPMFFSLSHWGRADAKLTVSHGPAEGEIEGSNHLFNAATGEYEGVKPIIGKAPSLGNAIFAWIGPLHFGNFAGLLSKAVWIGLGLATCYVTLTGLQLWVERRRDSRTWQMLSRSIPIVGYGVPIGLIGAAFGFFLTFTGPDPAFWTAQGFILACVLSIVVGVAVKDRATLTRTYQMATAAGLIALPALRIFFAGGTGWSGLLTEDGMMVLTMDLLMIITAGLSFAVAMGFKPERGVGTDGQAKQPSLQPAE